MRGIDPRRSLVEQRLVAAAGRPTDATLADRTSTWQLQEQATHRVAHNVGQVVLIRE